MLIVAGQPRLDTWNWKGTTVQGGISRPVRWIALEQIRAPKYILRNRGGRMGPPGLYGGGLEVEIKRRLRCLYEQGLRQEEADL